MFFIGVQQHDDFPNGAAELTVVANSGIDSPRIEIGQVLAEIEHFVFAVVQIV